MRCWRRMRDGGVFEEGLLPGMQARVGLGLVVPLVLFEEAVEDLLANDGADGVAGALASVVEAVVEAAGLVEEVVPAVDAGYFLVDGAVDAPQFHDVRVHASLIVDEVVRGSESVSYEHDLATAGVQLVA